MPHIVHRADPWWRQCNPWLALLSFVFTAFLATVEGWSAEDLAWSFWLAGLILGAIYLIVYHVAQGGLRFPPVRDVRVFWAATRKDVENRVFEE